jgi:DNA-binding transcriptional LysR family regulator
VDQIKRNVVRFGSERCMDHLVDIGELLSAFRAQEPGVELSFEHAGSDHVMYALSRSALDVGLVALSLLDVVGAGYQGVATFELRREPFVLLVPPGHRLAGEPIAGWDELERESFVDLGSVWLLHRIIEDAFSARRRNRRVTMTVDDVQTLGDLVARGFGAAILPASMAARMRPVELPRCAVAAPELAWGIHVAIADTAGSAARRLATLMVPADSAGRPDGCRTASAAGRC